MNNIILIGFMAVGKSTVAKSLRQNIHFNLFDIDKLVEEQEGMSIASLFKEKGEAYFREKEAEAAKLVLSRNNSIVSFGGGLFLNPEIRELALKDNFVVFLDLNLREVFRRIRRNDKRPLARHLNFRELKALYDRRLPAYRLAHFHVRGDRKRPAQTAEEIAQAYYRWLDKEEI